jgi:uncharacterized protein
MKQLFIDADSHVTEPPDLWTSRLPKIWHDRVPRIVNEADGVQSWYLGDHRMGPMGLSCLAGWSGPFPSHPPNYETAHPGAYEAQARLRYMDASGILAQVIYPNILGFGSDFLTIDDAEIKLGCVRAYNDFLSEWCLADKARLLPIIATPFWSAEESAKEIERCASRNFRGILFTGEPQRFGLPFLADKYWEPLWCAAEETGLPISFHIGSAGFMDDFAPSRLSVNGFAGAYVRSATKMYLENGIHFIDLLVSGVLPRHPKLRFVSAESGIGWIPFMLEAADNGFLQSAMRSEHPEFKELPSTYFNEQVYSCCWFERIAHECLLGSLNMNRILFETDFPHVACHYGKEQVMIQDNLPKDPSVRRKILLTNAADLYRVRLPPELI